MKLLSIGKSDLKTPYIGMGTWAIGGGVWWGENDDVLSIHTVHEALDHGAQRSSAESAEGLC